jgi:hypothetical protein
MKIAIAPIMTGTTVCHATTEESPCPISLTPEEKAVPPAFRPLLRYDLLVRKNKPEFWADVEEGRGTLAAASADVGSSKTILPRFFAVTDRGPPSRLRRAIDAANRRRPGRGMAAQ